MEINNTNFVGSFLTTTLDPATAEDRVTVEVSGGKEVVDVLIASN